MLTSRPPKPLRKDLIWKGYKFCVQIQHKWALNYGLGKEVFSSVFVKEFTRFELRFNDAG
jgi:hypothetical protein